MGWHLLAQSQNGRLCSLFLGDNEVTTSILGSIAMSIHPLGWKGLWVTQPCWAGTGRSTLGLAESLKCWRQSDSAGPVCLCVFSAEVGIEGHHCLSRRFTCRTITEPRGVLGTQEPRRGAWSGRAHPIPGSPGGSSLRENQIPPHAPLVLPAQAPPTPSHPWPSCSPDLLHYHKPRAVPLLLGGALKTSLPPQIFWMSVPPLSFSPRLLPF